MFTGLPTAPLPYRDPWTAPFEERIADLSAGERHIAYFYDRPDTSTFRYRVFNMVEALNATRPLEVSASWFTRDDAPYIDRFIDRADALVLCRARYNAAISRLAARARARGTRIFFDIDDLVFDPNYTHLLLDTLDQPTGDDGVWNDWFGWISRTGATLRLCDAAIVTNQMLADRVTACVPGMATRIVPNFLNRRQQAESEQIWRAKCASDFERNQKIHIGYFSGTPTHNRDFEIAAGALDKLLDEDPRVVVRMVGFLEARGPVPRRHDRIEVYPLQDFLNLQRLIGEVEINIAPLQTNTFTDCKSNLKYFEAAIVGTLTIASPSFTFRQAIRDGENGMLAKSHEWYAKLSASLQTVSDTRRYAAIVECAFKDAQERYGWNRHADAIVSAVFGSNTRDTVPDTGVEAKAMTV